MGDLGWPTALVTQLSRQPQNVWLAALAVGCLAPLMALVTPRLSWVVGLCTSTAAFALALVATVEQQTMVALGLITLAVAAGFLASWSGRTRRQAVGPITTGPLPRHRPRNVTLTRAQSRSFDYLLMR